MKILVTGATGFLGRPVVKRLIREGYEVTAVGHKTRYLDEPIEYIRADLVQGFPSWRGDVVINLAGRGDNYYEIVRQLRLCLPDDCLCIHASSMTVYGQPRYLPVDEKHRKVPEHEYGRIKLESEYALRGRAWILRFTGLFSEHRRDGVLYNFIMAAQQDKPLIIKGAVPWDVLHVDDAVEAIMLTLKCQGCPQTLNISYGEMVDIYSIAKTIIAITGSKSKIPHNPHCIPFLMDIRKAKEIIGWNPPTLNERLKELCESLGGKL